MEKEVKNLLKLAKKTVSKKIYGKFKKIGDENELMDTTKYAIISALKEDYQNMEIKIKGLENEMKDVFFAKNKLLLIPYKIKHFQVDFNKNDFNKVTQLFKSVQDEIKNV